MLHLSGLFSVDKGQWRSREKTEALARIMCEHRDLSKYDEWQGLRSSILSLAYHIQRLERVEYVVLLSGWLLKKFWKFIITWKLTHVRVS